MEEALCSIYSIKHNIETSKNTFLIKYTYYIIINFNYHMFVINFANTNNFFASIIICLEIFKIDSLCICNIIVIIYFPTFYILVIKSYMIIPFIKLRYRYISFNRFNQWKKAKNIIRFPFPITNIFKLIGYLSFSEGSISSDPSI